MCSIQSKATGKIVSFYSIAIYIVIRKRYLNSSALSQVSYFESRAGILRLF